MSKEWLFWGGGGRSKSTKKRRPNKVAADREAEASAPAGCMCAVLQLFDLHHFPFALHHQPSFKPGSFLPDEPTICKGLEAPRNSLELEGSFAEAAAPSSSSTIKLDQENLHIPVKIQIKTTCDNKSPRVSTSKSRTDDLLSECSSSSPGAKTPTLVARLMGLEQLPESASGSPSLNSSTLNNFVTNSYVHPQGQCHRRDRACNNRRNFYDTDNVTSGTLSLPETPRISAARRSDVEHRLSLQINKENIGEEIEFCAKKLARRISELKREDENRRGGGGGQYIYNARQIVKQVKESVGRKVGLDITNTIKSRDQRKDDNVVLLKPKKLSSSKVVLTRNGDHESSQSKQSTPSFSPRLLDSKNKSIITKTQASYSPRLSPILNLTSPESQPKPKPHVAISNEVQKQKQNSALVKKCKKDGKLPRVYYDGIRIKKEEPFVRTSKGNGTDKKCKKTPLSNDLLNISVSTLLPVKKKSFHHYSGPTKFGDKKSQASSDVETWNRSTKISSSSSQSCKQEEEMEEEDVMHKLTFQENNRDRCEFTSISTPKSPGGNDEAVEEEYQNYIQRILKRTGIIIGKSTPVSLAKWYSPSHPLDPSIFHYIELFHPTSKTSKLNLKCNRRLVFQLVDELLAEILNPFNLNLKQCHLARRQMYGSELMDTLISRIGSFPSADCQVLEDIDTLVDADLRSSSKSSWVPDEGEEGIVLEIEREIVESLVHDTAMAVAFG